MNFTKKASRRALALLAALVLGGLTVIPVLAFQGIGNSPYAADLLVSGLNTGELLPGQEYWYAYSRADLGRADYDSIILSLNYESEAAGVANRVNFQVFTFGQVEKWLEDNSGPVDSLGLGTPASADFDVYTSERMWSGPVAPNEVYYVRIFNLSPSPVQFRLTALGQSGGRLMNLAHQPTVPDSAAVIPASANFPGQAANPPTTPPISAGALPAPSNDSNNPSSTGWLLAAQAIQDLPPQEAAAWLMSAATLGWLPGGSGAAVPPSVPVDPNPGTDVVADAGDGDTQPDVTVEESAEAEVELPSVPDPTTGESIYPNQPIKLLYGPNTGVLAPKSEHWYTFTPGKVDDELIEEFIFTMFFTPGEPNISRYVNFELFTGGQYHIWERGTPLDMEHFGAGAWVSRDNDYMTGERLWRGTVVDGDQYFLKITNDTNKWIDYHLVPADIINTELGEPTVNKPQPAPATPTGKDIGAPLLLNKSRNSGQLASGQEKWFSLTTPNTNPDSYDFLDYLVELTHKPGYGSVAHHINVEIYPFQEQQIWRRGDTDDIVPLGVGSFTEYNELLDTHTWIWDGNLVSNTTYFVRIRNGSPQDVDYDLLIRRK